MHLNLVVGGVDNISKSWNTLMQTLNQDSQPIGMRARLSWLSASRLRLGVWGDVVLVCLGVVWVAEQWLEGVACGKDSLFGVLDRFCFFRLVEEWLLLIWRDTRDIGHWQTRIIPSFDGRTPLSTMIFMIRL